MGRTARISAVLLVLTSEILQAASTGTRITLAREPSWSYIQTYLERQEKHKTSLNHEFAGFTDPATAIGSGAAPPHPPPGFSERTVRVCLGRGKTTYESARCSLLRWKMHEGSNWARIFLGRRSKEANSQVQMVTVAKACAGLAWCINPCQVLYERKDQGLNFLVPPGKEHRHSLLESQEKGSRIKANAPLQNSRDDSRDKSFGRLWAGKAPRSAPGWATFAEGSRFRGKQSAVAYATKEGHLIQGEERMRVLWFCGKGGDDSVWFEVYSVSRGAGLVGGIVFPLVRPMQRRFFREQAEIMRRIVNHPSLDGGRIHQCV